MNKEELKELAATLNGIADGKAWERTNSITGEWCDPDHWDPEKCLWMGRKIRLKPWSLPSPPEGQQWHRMDWTEEMLEGGYRPLLNGEAWINGDQVKREYSLINVWHTCGDFIDDAIGQETTNRTNHCRTKRPLPQTKQPDPYAEFRKAYADGMAIQVCVIWSGDWVDISTPKFDLSPDKYRIKPQQQKVLLKPEDVPPGTVFHHDSQIDGAWQVVTTGGCGDGVYIDKMYVKFSAMERYKMNRSIPLTGMWDSEAWEPCHRFEQTD